MDVIPWGTEIQQNNDTNGLCPCCSKKMSEPFFDNKKFQIYLNQESKMFNLPGYIRIALFECCTVKRSKINFVKFAARVSIEL